MPQLYGRAWILVGEVIGKGGEPQYSTGCLVASPLYLIIVPFSGPQSIKGSLGLVLGVGIYIYHPFHLYMHPYTTPFTNNRPCMCDGQCQFLKKFPWML